MTRALQSRSSRMRVDAYLSQIQSFLMISSCVIKSVDYVYKDECLNRVCSYAVDEKSKKDDFVYSIV